MQETPKEKLLKDFSEMFNLVEAQVGVNERERFSRAIDEYVRAERKEWEKEMNETEWEKEVKEKVDDAYKKGYNQRLRDEGKVGERWQHLYL